MKITIVQQNIHWADCKRNALEADELIGSAGESDIYVLPEMWNSGFAISGEALRCSAKADTLACMKHFARERNAAVCGSVAIEDKDAETASTAKYRNRLFFVKPDGTFSYYDKRHLFRHGGEDKFFLPGSERAIATWKGWRFLLLICYDLRFPVWSRYNGDYDGIIIVANWPSCRQTAWDTLLKARAIENQCYVIGCNRVGDDPRNHYAGGSCIIGPDGSVIAHCPDEEAWAVKTEISLEELKRYRAEYNFLADKDNNIKNI